MLLRCLGVAAGGGYPQWNCACTGCRKARERPGAASFHAGLAVSGTGQRWFLLNATPDVHHQIAATPSLHPGPGVRDTPVAGVLLSDAEFDHTIGLLVLREGSPLSVYATPPVLDALGSDFPVSELLADYAELSWRELRTGDTVELDEQLQVTAFPTGSKPPRYVRHPKPFADWEIGFHLRDTVTGGTAVYAPTVPRWDADFAARLDGVDCVMIDGTFFTDDEMTRGNTGTRRGRDMGHLAVGGADGSLRMLARLPAKRKVYTHVNNTNPILDPESPEHQLLTKMGVEVGRAGLEVEL
ncbi:metal-dependent hydrolase, beta-lactamase superfamily I [Saccharomonospora marina XMU15]|uniref:Coenzyme PQQ synthesis protein B n=1 Tax=Saccharomonospora marina XMU15 TaxID=882083 RepID=H5WYP5_9PSEU|nr:pyrroloquinoline quinone biosynthesis protein PqqB [Saccharomonospora marina]EHR50710.1 metal-dependent hydrolase, beta-lactamase superfamily I [Saccharomonospora marina XMU15]